ncbi:MAG TPA: hypothetical protein VMG10_27935, partial [Gemmataceae bacterium]|nr:hypothetical protein [Gemmataceae bacterium]
QYRASEHLVAGLWHAELCTLSPSRAGSLRSAGSMLISKCGGEPKKAKQSGGNAPHSKKAKQSGGKAPHSKKAKARRRVVGRQIGNRIAIVPPAG